MELTTLCWLIMMFIFGVSAGKASLIARPNRSQFFEYECVYMSCEVQGNSTGWSLKRNITTEKFSESGVESLLNNGTNYHINAAKSSDSGVYWCESESGEHSNTVNITVHDSSVILESPALPVTEGKSVNLRCRYQTPPSELTADFYKDGSLIRTEPTGEMTIPVVKESDEGLYSCRHSELKGSPESWMTVAAATSSSPPSSPSPSPPSSPSSPLLLPLSLSGLAVLSIPLIVLLVLFCYHKRNKPVGSEPRDVTYGDVTILQDPKPNGRREKSLEADPVYSAVKTSNLTASGFWSSSGDVVYADISFTQKRKHTSRREKAFFVDLVDSEVKPDQYADL